MGILGSIIKTGVDIVTLPVDVVADVGSALNGEEPDATEKKIEKVLDDIF